jgi:hypothetical protein
MRAAEELAKQRREYPLYSTDRAAALFGRMVPLADSKLESLRQAQALLVGEVNRPLPNAKTFHYPDGSHAIMLFSGLLDFFSSTARILLGGSHMHREGKVENPFLSPEDVIANLQALFERWTPEGIATGRNTNEPPIVLSKESAESADALGQSALLFILSHELGHFTYYKPPEDDEPSTNLTRDQEFAADKIGFLKLVAEGPGSQRMRCAGGIVALRVLAVFGSLGHTFPPGHPLPLERLDALMASLREAAADERVFWQITPIAFSYDEMVETAGIRAAKTGMHAPLTPARMFSRLSAVLEQCVRDNTPSSIAAGVMRFDCERAAPEMLEEVAETAARILQPAPPPTDSPYWDKVWTNKAQLYQSLFSQLPETAATVFRAAYQKRYPEKG